MSRFITTLSRKESKERNNPEQSTKPMKNVEEQKKAPMKTTFEILSIIPGDKQCIERKSTKEYGPKYFNCRKEGHLIIECLVAENYINA